MDAQQEGEEVWGNTFFVIVHNRTVETLNKVIAHHAWPGTHVIPDCWVGYNNIEAILDGETVFGFGGGLVNWYQGWGGEVGVFGRFLPTGIRAGVV